ncbi:hypothetical protein [Streptococcus porcorum]|uniref:Uncharacterized protein n=1 Tax=Streptococcus porcorum TaxID=701526 RepID=A0ABV2JFZ4_9STRE
MKKNLKIANHYYLLYLENKELRKIKSYIAKKSSDTFSFEEKIILLKLHEFYKNYNKVTEGKSISLEKFLGITKSNKNHIKTAIGLFENYFSSKGLRDRLVKSHEKIILLQEKNKGTYDIKESLRTDKLKKRAEKILWHIPSKNSIHKLFLDDKSSKNNSLFYITNINNFESLMKFLNISKLDVTVEHLSFVFLQKALKKKKVDIASIENEHTQLQAELSDYYDLIKFYYFS